MTYSILIFLTRASHLTLEQFQEYYEHKHIPLFYSMMSDIWPTTFSRRYFARINRKGFGGPANPDHPPLTLRGELNEMDCDCVGEMTFPSEKAFRVFYKRIYEKETAAILAEHENKFLEHGKVRVIVVGETWSTGPDGVTTSEKSEITKNEASDSEMSSSEG
ncbi:hypothetical protein DE146DRAFT_471488 [Phaeosphaeria sp. MPI-PUGE-AT-0046c]|nr:hypothetical protein DE146DRAFT_471488 [Phaeosphaeria sp. MPI-PUGE-AT-0046c]